MGHLNVMKKPFAPAAVLLITSFVLATPVLVQVPLANPETARPAFSSLAPLSY